MLHVSTTVKIQDIPKIHTNYVPILYNMSIGYLGPLHMSPVDRAGSVTEMKLVSVHMVTFSPLSEMKISKKRRRDHSGVNCNEQAWREFLDFLFKQPQISFDFTLTIK